MKIAKGFSITEGNQFEEDAVDPTMLPFQSLSNGVLRYGFGTIKRNSRMVGTL